MPTLRTTQKAERVLTFLLSLHDDRIAGPLSARGMHDEDIEEGLALLRALVRPTFVGLRPPQEQPEAIERLARFRRENLGIVSATLRNRSPAAHEFLLGDLPDAPILMAMSFLERYDRLALPKRQRGLGPEGADAKTWLTRRGVDEAVIAALRQDLATAKGFGDLPPEGAEKAAEEREEAERRLWAYYQEWSHIARSAIRDQNLLRKMGIRRDGESG